MATNSLFKSGMLLLVLLLSALICPLVTSVSHNQLLCSLGEGDQSRPRAPQQYQLATVRTSCGTTQYKQPLSTNGTNQASNRPPIQIPVKPPLLTPPTSSGRMCPPCCAYPPCGAMSTMCTTVPDAHADLVYHRSAACTWLMSRAAQDPVVAVRARTHNTMPSQKNSPLWGDEPLPNSAPPRMSHQTASQCCPMSSCCLHSVHATLITHMCNAVAGQVEVHTSSIGITEELLGGELGGIKQTSNNKPSDPNRRARLMQYTPTPLQHGCRLPMATRSTFITA
jgi:hypothetical protein